MQNRLFPGQPIFSQILKLLPSGLIAACVNKHNSDHYYKRFKSYDHLVTMLFTAFAGCRSLREVTTGLLVWHKRLKHLGLNHVPRRSTLSDANRNRNAALFRDIFHSLYAHYFGGLPDSRTKKDLLDRLFMIDSTTVSLFQEIMKGTGSRGKNGKRKGGAKAHLLINAREDVPQLAVITSASKSDKMIMPLLELPKGSILVFDRGYISFAQWQRWDQAGIYWVTRAMKTNVFRRISDRKISNQEMKKGVLCDQIGEIRTKTANKEQVVLRVRKIVFQCPVSGKIFTFLTNHMRFLASTIANIYKQRWQIEMLFKRLKQNYPLRYFLGDNENAIRIQIWCSLICDLIVKIIKERTKGRRWSYSNLAAILRLHLATYIDLAAFLQHPEKALDLENRKPLTRQATLFET